MYEEQKTENKSLVIPGFPCVVEGLNRTGSNAFTSDDLFHLKKGDVLIFVEDDGQYFKMEHSLFQYVKKNLFIVAEDFDKGEDGIGNGNIKVFVNAVIDEEVLESLNPWITEGKSYYGIPNSFQYAGNIVLQKTI